MHTDGHSLLTDFIQNLIEIRNCDVSPVQLSAFRSDRVYRPTNIISKMYFSNSGRSERFVETSILNILTITIDSLCVRESKSIAVKPRLPATVRTRAAADNRDILIHMHSHVLARDENEQRIL
ncbi:hypothetical protein AVEN_208843-1 [Araneus ventricosus]|uniref:Uncharacterized protein n=1 Tax=Araneus ventricosus TaxID=182803 RepID=A0A4Y2F2G7_ARAVE|nr:hypothetical protein AVEN_231762-1 [Araneus ventricosus]GBM35874.1 hypothetical protein AVEN_208843-1 [Araneus ventricosus]